MSRPLPFDVCIDIVSGGRESKQSTWLWASLICRWKERKHAKEGKCRETALIHPGHVDHPCFATRQSVHLSLSLIAYQDKSCLHRIFLLYEHMSSSNCTMCTVDTRCNPSPSDSSPAPVCAMLLEVFSHPELKVTEGGSH